MSVDFVNDITATFTESLFSGSSASVAEGTVPWAWDIGLGGRPYLLDLEPGQFSHRSIQLLRSQGDASNEPAEASINPEDLWRRGQSSWHLGAGQVWLDRDSTDLPQSARSRFRSSKGCDTWTENQMSLLNDVDIKKASANTNLMLMPAGTRLYLTDGTSIQFVTTATDDSWSLTDLTGEPATAATSICSDGYNVWTTHGADGLFNTNTGSTVTAAYRTGTTNVCAFVKGRLMVGGGASVYNVTSGGGGALPTALFTHGTSTWTWVGFAEGRQAIYAAGYAGDKSLIYRFPIKPDGSALDVPIVAGELPDGEVITGIGSYLGFILVGTSKGVRYAEADSQGNLTFGHLFGPLNTKCFEGQDRFVWFGWTNYDGTSTGLGRCDLSVFGDLDKRIPAYASDLMATTQNAVTTVVTFGTAPSDVRYFAVSGIGFYGEDVTHLVTSGTLESGLVAYGLPEQKVAVEQRVRYGPSFAGDQKSYVSADGGAWTLIGTHLDTATDNSGDTFPFPQTTAENFEIRITLDRDASVLTTGPTLTRWVMRAQPAAALTYNIVLPLLFADRVVPRGVDQYLTPSTELEQIKTWHASREVLTLQIGDNSFSVMLEDYDFRPTHMTETGSDWNGTCFTTVKVL